MEISQKIVRNVNDLYFDAKREVQQSQNPKQSIIKQNKVLLNKILL